LKSSLSKQSSDSAGTKNYVELLNTYWLNLVAIITANSANTRWLPFVVCVGISVGTVFILLALITQDGTHIRGQFHLSQAALIEAILIDLLLTLIAHLAYLRILNKHSNTANLQEIEHEIAQYKQAQAALLENQTRLRLINSISLGMMVHMSVHQLIERAVKQINEYFSTFRVAYSTINNKGQLTVIHSIEPQGMPRLKGLVIDLTSAPQYLSSLRLNEPVIVEDVSQDSRLASLADTMKAFGTQSLLNVTFYHQDHSVGLLCFESPESRSWSEHEIATLVGVAQYLSILVKDTPMQQECQRTEAALYESEERFKTFMNNSPIIAFIKDEQGRYLYVNELFEHLFNVKLVELAGKTDFDWLPKETAKQLHENDSAVFCTGKATELLEIIPTAAGRTHYWLVFKFLIKHDPERRLLGGVAVDITERKQAEEKIKASLQEKEVLLKEVHHRVKNNLQVIDSLFRHQRRHIKDKRTNEILKECQNRVISMALLHEKIYQSKDLSKVDFSGYIRSLVANLIDSHAINVNLPILEIEIADVFLEISTALPCGLIVNELVSNALKYAFDSTESGKIYISFRPVNDGKFLLIVKDNGIGLPKDLEFHNPQSLGLKLVKSLVRQLQGFMNVNCCEGTEFQITLSGVRDDTRN